ncbi:hypothetical protein BX600DRAFT_451985 [Xylariales sp. PMI_506]|nr:hypothetical protein BX600DRAFT_451985 [Xylariales sp. PMI_506]
MSCYGFSKGQLEINFGFYPCGEVNTTTPAVSCCAAGDSCLTEGICSYTHSQVNGSGYYIGGCTDSTWASPYCQKRCADLYSGDVVYSTSTGLWACCSENDSTPDCTIPTSETFLGAAPQALDDYFDVPATGFSYTSVSLPTSTTTASSATTTTSSATTKTSSVSTTTSKFSSFAVITTTPSTTPSSTAAVGGASSENPTTGSGTGLSAGASAGIGIGVAAVAILIAALVAWFFQRQRHRKRATSLSNTGFDDPRSGLSDEVAYKHHQYPNDGSYQPVEISDGGHDTYGYQFGRAELTDTGRPGELPETTYQGELPG